MVDWKYNSRESELAVLFVRGEEVCEGEFGMHAPNRPSQISDILETVVYVDDLEKAEDFYRRVIGLEFVSRHEGRRVFFRCGNRMFLIFNPAETIHETEMTPGHGAQGSVHVAFAVHHAELEAWKKYLEDSGVPIEKDVTWPEGARSLYFRDPAGNCLELASPMLWKIPESVYWHG